jgi:hypothetical protein
MQTKSISIKAMREETAPQQHIPPFPPLALVTKPNLTTAELAYYSNMAVQSWRVKACYDTAPEGLRPLRVCGKLAWPTSGAKKLLGVA